jgi:DNA-binding LytR/AlgR family response regulator
VGTPPGPGTTLSALVVDDETPARSELAWLLGTDPRVSRIRAAASSTEALRALDAEQFDVVFCDIRMPGLDGIELARVLSRFAVKPQVVFVTAYDDHAVDAFDVAAIDYLLKPVRPERLAEAVRRAAEAGAGGGGGPGEGGEAVPDETIAVELGGVTQFVQRSQVRFAVAHGDYVRLHTATSNHLVRITLSTLEERWGSAGFARIHRSTLVALAFIDEVHIDEGRCAVRLGNRILPVSRRHSKALRDRLVRAASLNRTTSTPRSPSPTESPAGR